MYSLATLIRRPRYSGFLAMAALALFATLAPARAQTNLLVNPGFETPPPYVAATGGAGAIITGNVANGWSDNTSWATGINIAYSQDTTTFHGGASSQKAVISAGFMQLVQWINFSQGYTTGSIWLKAASPTWVTLGLAQAGTPYTVYADQAYRIGTSWTQVTVTGYTAATAGALMIKTAGTGTIWLDDGSMVFYGNNPPAQSFTPPATAIPRAYFGMHMEHLYESPNIPWPSVDFGTTRSQDELLKMWADVETSRGVYNWTAMDTWVNDCIAHNCAISYCGRETPSWATTNTTVDQYGYVGGAGVPTNMTDWQDFITAVATRYKGKIASYEIWNEPNLVYWAGTPAQMAQMETSMATAVHAADPAALVVSAPVFIADLPANMTWADQYFAAGGGSHSDVIGFHLYNPTPEADQRSMIAWRNLLTAYGLQNKPQYNTETGWGFTNTGGGSQAMSDTIAYVGRMYVLDWALGITRSFWYGWSELSNVGIRQDGGGHWTVQTQGAVAYAQVENWLSGATMTSSGTDTNGNYVTQVNETNGYQGWIVWNPNTTTTYTVPGGVTRMRDLQGNTTTPGATISATGTPVILEKPVGSIPPVPTGLSAMAGNAQVALSWNASTGATAYDVKRSTVSGSGYVTVSSPTTTSYTNTGLTNGTTYYFVVDAKNTSGTSGNSSQVSATPSAGSSGLIKINTGGPAVSPFVADTDFSGGNSATNWTGTIDTSAVTSPAPQAVYQSERWGASTYTMGGLTPSTNYTVRLHFCENYFTASGQRTFNVSINSTQVLSNFDIYATVGAAHKANIQQFTAAANGSGQIVIVLTTVINNALINGIEVNALGAPPTPTGLAATPGNAQVALTWNASSGATAYDVKRSTVSGSGYVTVSSPTVTNYTNTGLTNGTTYYFVVDAKNAAGTSGNSSQVSATPSGSSGNTHGGTWAGMGAMQVTATFKNMDQFPTGIAANQTYTASFWLKGTGNVSLQVWSGTWGTAIHSQTFNATSTWTQCSFTFSTGSNTQLSYIFEDPGGTAGTIYIDDCFMGILNGTNVLTNPGFESGATGWNIDAGSPWSIVQNP